MHVYACAWLQAVDARAGAWDLHVAERMVKLGLWCCMHEARTRPALGTVHSELARLLAQAQSQGQAQMQMPTRC